ncbi:hypothetical protein STURON_00630 [Spiroplasma turonicum]|uniref:Uncharacterized protein n=1 Tax=Spiroplasma turonicum TaxID=216946 RepID=A0A0K1P6D2_9MOLU|nr:hypothetical protein STURON_00630 [Spiroplasma turonicum]
MQLMEMMYITFFEVEDYRLHENKYTLPKENPWRYNNWFFFKKKRKIQDLFIKSCILGHDRLLLT